MSPADVLTLLASGATALGGVAPGPYGVAARLGGLALGIAAKLVADMPATVTRIRSSDELLLEAVKARRARTKTIPRDHYLDELERVSP